MVATGLESHQQPLTPATNPPPDLRPMTLTFLLTDVEGSTRLWEVHHEAMERALARHDRLVSQAVAHHGGRLVKAKGEGDSTFSVFDSPASAVAAALELQRTVAAEPWSLPVPWRCGSWSMPGMCRSAMPTSTGL
jgi:class 3 adenylate cyclase